MITSNPSFYPKVKPLLSKHSHHTLLKREIDTDSIKLDQLLGYEEALEVTHLPDADHTKDDQLQHSPPYHTRVGQF
jgi:hypothetical protein